MVQQVSAPPLSKHSPSADRKNLVAIRNLIIGKDESAAVSFYRNYFYRSPIFIENSSTNELCLSGCCAFKVDDDTCEEINCWKNNRSLDQGKQSTNLDDSLLIFFLKYNSHSMLFIFSVWNRLQGSLKATNRCRKKLDQEKLRTLKFYLNFWLQDQLMTELIDYSVKRNNHYDIFVSFFFSSLSKNSSAEFSITRHAFKNLAIRRRNDLLRYGNFRLTVICVFNNG